MVEQYIGNVQTSDRNRLGAPFRSETMKVKELIALLEQLEPELELYTFYDHGVIHKLEKNQIVLVDDESHDKFTPRGVVFCAHHDDDMELLVKNRNYKSVHHLD